MNYEVFKRVLECLESGNEPTYALRQEATRERININELKKIIGDVNEKTDKANGGITGSTKYSDAYSPTIG